MAVDRLKTRSEYLRVARGNKAARAGLVLQAAPRRDMGKKGGDRLAIRVGFTATKKIGNAVTRNRVKRRLRAVADRILPDRGKSGTDYVLIGRSATIGRPFAKLLDDLDSALQMIDRSQPHCRQGLGGEKK